MSDEIIIKYRPSPGQLPFHRDRYKVKYRGLIGGTGSGKSLGGAFEALSWSCELQGSVGLIVAPTFRNCKQIIVPALEDLLGMPLGHSPYVSKYNRTELTIEFVNGSRILMLGTDVSEVAEGLNIDWAWVDEARLMHDFGVTWKSVLRRLRGSGNVTPLDSHVPHGAVGAWVTTTPDQPRSALHMFFEDPVERDPEARVYRLRLDDNKDNLPPGYIAAVKRAHTGGLYARFVEGLFVAVEGVTFSFDYGVHVQGYVEPDPRVRRVAYGVDFGWTNPSAVVVVLLDGDNRAFVADEVYKSRMSEGDLINQCRELKRRWGSGPFWCDPSEPATIDAMRKAGLDAKPSKSKRDEGIREVGGRLRDAGDGRRRLYVSPGCVNLISEMQSYDAAVKSHDHAVDALRYCLTNAGEPGGSLGAAFLDYTAPRRRYGGPRIWRP